MRPHLQATSILVLFVLLAGCTSEDTSPVITGATDQVAEPLPDFADPSELEQAVSSFGECVEQSFPIVIRFRADAFTGMSTEVGSQHEEDGPEVERVTAECAAQFDLERRISAYQNSQYSITPEDRRRLADEFVTCAGAISSEIASRVEAATLESDADVAAFMADLGFGGAEADELVALGVCEADMTGPALVFSDGHDWFTP